ncbi:antibiotic biosynthesis monooxygenase family protein [Actinoplanes sp. NPDC049265]|uniref:antibiotic biosynthesis monooxygenase family protein n=1 Tax=Actinoplanes sp. NPDC049265 TaxID=3363902 RepID=UPI00371D4025
MPITLINSFAVEPEHEERFLAEWRGSIAHFAAAPGFLHARLHRNTGLTGTAFQYVNVALWADADSYRAVFEGYVPPGQRVPGVTAYPGLFEVLHEVDPS